ncbi:hypothetical protein [Marinospirillum perlucidum]|uniref:hypothetical protein n=1 Tax=Marinospirillum perlucidum TaxID=1982602 RepID=UPI000DF42A9D|nr:hypothetical protein [Marinospirillum perlucidum]
MRIQGSLQAPHLPRPLKQPKKAATPAEETPRKAEEVIRLAPQVDVDYISAEEAREWDQAGLSLNTRKALQGYWSVAHQAHLWSDWQRVDLYV